MLSGITHRGRNKETDTAIYPNRGCLEFPIEVGIEIDIVIYLDRCCQEFPIEK